MRKFMCVLKKKKLDHKVILYLFLIFDINVRIYSLRFIVVVSICCVVRKYITLAVGRSWRQGIRWAQQGDSFYVVDDKYTGCQ